MQLKQTGTQWNRDTRNDINDNWDKIQNNFNNAVQATIDEGKEQIIDELVDTTKLNWLEAVETYSDIAINYPSPNEGDTVNVTEEGKVYRFNGSDWIWIQGIDPGPYNQLNEEVAGKAEIEDVERLEKLKRSLGSIPYGEIAIPEDFRELPCEFYRDFDGKVKHNMDFDQYKDGTEIYCDSLNGSNSSGDGTEGNPFQTVWKAIESANAGVDDKYVIKCLSTHFTRGWAIQDQVINGKTIAIVPDNEDDHFILSNHFSGLSWTDEGNGVWRATRSAVISVFDLRRKDVFGVPKPLENKETLTECQNESYSWYTDDTDVWIHTGDGLTPDDTNYVINVSHVFVEPTLQNGGELYIEKASFLHGANFEDFRIYGDTSGTSATGEFVANNCIFAGGDLRVSPSNATNGIATKDVKNVYLFNCKIPYSAEDGFNYHFVNISESERRDCLVIEYDCISYSNGKHSTSNTSNATTCHDGACILRINSIGYKSRGPVLADVNGCYSILIDCAMRDSTTDNTNQKNAFQFNNNNAVEQGKAILINCSGGGDGTYSISTDAGFDITLQAFHGFEFPEGFEATIVS